MLLSSKQQATKKYKSLFDLVQDQATKDKVLQSMASMSSAQIVSAGALSQLPNNRIDMNQPLTYKHSVSKHLLTFTSPTLNPALIKFGAQDL